MSSPFHAGQYATLLATGLRLSLTGNRRADAGGGIGEGGGNGASGADASLGEDGSRHLLGAAYGLTLSTIVSSILFQNAAPPEFLIVTLSLAMIFTATTMVGELAGGLFHPLDLAVLGPLPVSGFTRFAARFTELMAMLLILTLNLNLVPAVLFAFLTGGGVIAVLFFLATAFCASLFTGGLCLVLYIVLARFMSAARFEGAMLYINIFITLGVLGLLVNIGALIQWGALGSESGGNGWLYLFPPAWFSGMALVLLGLPVAVEAALPRVLVALAVAVVPLLAAALRSERLLQSLGGGNRRGRRRSSSPGRIMRLFERLFVTPRERAAFEFTAINLARDHGFRMKAYPILGIPIMMMTMSLFESEEPLFYLVMLHLMNIYLPLILAFLPFGDHFQGGWIFNALPAEAPQRFAMGAEKAFIYRIMLPLIVLNAAILSAIWSPWIGLLNALYASLVGLFLVGIRFRTLRCYPFSREFRGVITQDVMGVFMAGIPILGGLALLQYSTIDSPTLLLGQIVLMVGLHWLRYDALARKREDSDDKGGSDPGAVPDREVESANKRTAGTV